MSSRAVVHCGTNVAAARRLLDAGGGREIANYGRALLIRAEAETLQALREAGYRLREIGEPGPVRVGAFALDARSTATPEGRAAAARAPGSTALRVLRLAGPMHGSWPAALAALGARIHERLEPEAYLIAVSDSRLDELAALPFVETVAPFPPALKIDATLLSPSVRSSLPAEELAMLGDRPTPPAPPRPDPTTEQLTEEAFLGGRRRRSPEQIGNLEIALFEDVDPDALAASLARAGARVVRAGARSAVVFARSSALPAIAALAPVREIRPHAEPTLYNDVAARILGVAAAHDGHGLDGRRQIVAIADTGLDTGDQETLLADFRGRVVGIQALGRAGDASDPDNHGTHVAGSVLGNGSASGGQVRGMAPAAELVFQSIMDAGRGLGGLPADLASGLFQRAFDEGARIHTNSWGSRESDGAYLEFARQADRFAFEHRDFLILFAAGNDAPFHVSSPGTAKNVLTVGASESERPLPTEVRFPNSPKFPEESFPGGPVWGNFHRQADSAADVAAFSCPGPVEIGRVKPDLVAPGTFILSTRSTVSTADRGGDGLPDSGDEDGLFSHEEAVGRGLPGGPLFGAGDRPAPPLPAGAGDGAERHYFFSSGTSMATPLVAGACALLRQFLTESGARPSGALLKALAIHGARDLGLGVPHNLQGWGRFDLGRAIPIEGSGIRYVDELEDAVASGEIRAYRISVAPGAGPLTVTLVWRDAPGRALQNRLHLRVIDAASREERGAERIDAVANNVQRITLADPPPGAYRIEVEGLEVATGVPELAGLRQDFALVAGPVTELTPA